MPSIMYANKQKAVVLPKNVVSPSDANSRRFFATNSTYSGGGRDGLAPLTFHLRFTTHPHKDSFPVLHVPTPIAEMTDKLP